MIGNRDGVGCGGGSNGSNYVDKFSIFLLKISYFLLFGSHGSFEPYLSVFFTVTITIFILCYISFILFIF